MMPLPPDNRTHIEVRHGRRGERPVPATLTVEHVPETAAVETAVGEAFSDDGVSAPTEEE